MRSVIKKGSWMRGSGSTFLGWRLLLGLALAIGMAWAGEARAGQALVFTSATNAGVSFTGNVSAASFGFYNNGLKQGFQVTQTVGYNDAVALFGTIGGTFTFGLPITSTGTPSGVVESAKVTGTNGDLTITDGSNQQFVTTLTAVGITSLGTAIAFDVKLTDAVYTGTNASLIALRNMIDDNNQGAQAAISLPFVPGVTLTDLLNGKHQTGYSGTLSPVPEPSSLALAGLSTAAMVGYTMRRRRTGRGS